MNTMIAEMVCVTLLLVRLGPANVLLTVLIPGLVDSYTQY
jgi:hypothetical protein